MLEVSHLEGIRGEKTLFSNLTFSAVPGQWIWVRGPNGSGKTTLLKTIIGLLPYAGKIQWKGKAMPRFHPSILQELIFLAHKPALHPALSPEENLEWFMSLYGSKVIRGNEKSNNRGDSVGETRNLLSTALEWIGLSAVRNVPCEQLSFGQCQRVALARLCLHPCGLWVLDEPCTGLDEKGQELFEKWLDEHLKNGGIAVIASHSSFKTAAAPAETIELKVLEPERMYAP